MRVVASAAVIKELIALIDELHAVKPETKVRKTTPLCSEKPASILTKWLSPRLNQSELAHEK
jgi:hypothetical protein